MVDAYRQAIAEAEGREHKEAKDAAERARGARRASRRSPSASRSRARRLERPARRRGAAALGIARGRDRGGAAARRRRRRELPPATRDEAARFVIAVAARSSRSTTSSSASASPRRAASSAGAPTPISAACSRARLEGEATVVAALPGAAPGARRVPGRPRDPRPRRRALRLPAPAVRVHRDRAPSAASASTFPDTSGGSTGRSSGSRTAPPTAHRRRKRDHDRREQEPDRQHQDRRRGAEGALLQPAAHRPQPRGVHPRLHQPGAAAGRRHRPGRHLARVISSGSCGRCRRTSSATKRPTARSRKRPTRRPSAASTEAPHLRVRSASARLPRADELRIERYNNEGRVTITDTSTTRYQQSAWDLSDLLPDGADERVERSAPVDRAAASSSSSRSATRSRPSPRPASSTWSASTRR